MTTKKLELKFADTFFDSLDDSDMTEEEKHTKALNEIEKNGGLEYYVTLMDFRLNDISPIARVKTAAKYFKKYEAAKIFQLVSIIEAQNDDAVYPTSVLDYTSEEIQEMRDKLKELVEKYPEYAI